MVLRVLSLVSYVALSLIDLLSLDSFSSSFLLPKSVEEGKDYRYVRKEEPENQYDRLVDRTNKIIVKG